MRDKMTRVGKIGAAVAALLAAALTTAVVHPATAGAAGGTKQISLDATNDDPNGASFGRSVSADGAFIAYSSDASDLVASDPNGYRDIFVRDRQGGANLLVSIGLGGAPADGDSGDPSISADGRYVAFASNATNLVLNDTNNRRDVFVRDLINHSTKRISIATGGGAANGISYMPEITGDGRYVAFASNATNLVAGDTNAKADVFVRDTVTKVTTRVSLTAGGGQGDGDSIRPSISTDGTRVVYESLATNLAPGVTNGHSNIFLRDRNASTTTRVSRTPLGKTPNGNSFLGAISADGSTVVYDADATNVVAGDANGFTDIFRFVVASATTTRVSVAEGGGATDGASYGRAISADGRYVAFSSDANNIVSSPGSQAPGRDVFEVDTTTGRALLISYDVDGEKANGSSFKPVMSTDATTIAFRSEASDLTRQTDDNGASDVFARSVVMVSVGSVSVPEGTTCAHFARFAVTLSAPDIAPVTVDYTTVDGSALAGSDYTATSGTLTFAPGVVSDRITVPVTCEGAAEGHESFTVALSNPTGATALLGRTTGTGSILNDDPGSTTSLAIGDAAVVEGDQGTRFQRVGVVLVKASATTVTVSYSTAGVSATDGLDFTGVAGTLTFLPGQTGMSIMIPILPDQSPETDETFTVTLSGGSVPITRAVGTVTILDDDPPYS